MAKRKQELTVVDTESKTANVGRFEDAADKSANVGAFEISADVVEFAASLGVDLGGGSIEDRADLAAGHMNRSQRHMLASGLLLASIKAECEHGAFSELIAERGFETRSAQKAMQYAQFIALQPEAERARLIEWPKSKVMELAGADAEVLNVLLLDGAQSIDALSVRALRQQIADLTANLADTAVQRDAAEAELEGARKKLAKGVPDREDGVPLVVADLRAEIVASQKKAELAVSSLRALGVDLVQLQGTEAAHDWADATLRLAVAALGAVRLQLDGVLKQYLDVLPGRDPAPTEKAYLSQQEVVETAQAFGQLVALHDHEKALREWDREQARPRGKGRPSAKPEAPKGGAK